MSLHTTTSEPVGGRATVIGLFRDSGAAERAIRELKDLGFTDGQIGVLMQDRTQERQFALDTGTKAGEGAAAGAVGGGVLSVLQAAWSSLAHQRRDRVTGQSLRSLATGRPRASRR